MRKINLELKNAAETAAYSYLKCNDAEKPEIERLIDVVVGLEHTIMWGRREEALGYLYALLRFSHIANINVGGENT